MWEAIAFLLLGFLVLFFLEPMLRDQPSKPRVPSQTIYQKGEKMNFPSNHITTSLITPENSPCSSRTVTRPSTPIPSSYRNSPVCLGSPIPLSRSSSRRSLFSHELHDSPSDHCHHG